MSATDPSLEEIRQRWPAIASPVVAATSAGVSNTNTTAPTLKEIQQWPATVSPAVAATALGISRSYAYELVKRGEFPVKVLKVGGKTRVITASILAALSGDGGVDAA